MIGSHINTAYKLDILFILKKRNLTSTQHDDWNYTYGGSNASGLYNSVRFINDMLKSCGIRSAMVEVVDNNDIHREVVKHQPQKVVIEALWVVPEKFDVLVPLLPNVEWYVRLHSEIPFLAQEGIAMEWLGKYAKLYPHVKIAANSKRATKEVSRLFDVPCTYMPNYYQLDKGCHRQRRRDEKIINVSCFGAIRPLKNQLAQAIAAIEFAEGLNLKLRFHINGSRKEANGATNYKNIIKLFEAMEGKHELVEHGWLSHADFMEVIKEQIDIGMQVSFTETYNIVAADHVNAGVPVVASPEVPFINDIYSANPTCIQNMVDKLHLANALSFIHFHVINKWNLKLCNRYARHTWKRIF